MYDLQKRVLDAERTASQACQLQAATVEALHSEREQSQQRLSEQEGQHQTQVREVAVWRSCFL